MQKSGQRTGIVAAARKEAIDVGDHIFKLGGNAVDAAIASSFALGVAEPYMTGIGAVGEIILGLPNGSVHVVDCAARAPLAAHAAMFSVVGDKGTGLYAWPPVENDANVYSHLAVAAPRLVHGLEEMHKRFGRLEWKKLVRPAADLARAGVMADHFTTAILAHEQATLKKDPLAREIYYPNETALCAPIDGNPSFIRNEALAAALDVIANHGAAPLNRDGAIGKAILQVCEAGGGILGAEDLGPFDIEVFENVEPYLEFAGWSVYGSPRPSGARSVADILEGLQIEQREMGADSADRYLAVAKASISAFNQRLESFSGGSSSTPTATTHVSVAGSDGMMVGITQTLLSLFGAQVTVKKYGFFLNNGMMWFDPRPGRTNSIAAGARALMAVSPVLVDRPKERKFVVGALGGRRIITAVAQVIENRARFNDGPQRAVNRPRVHADGIGPILLDHRLSDDIQRALTDLGEVNRLYYAPTTLNFARAFLAEYEREGSRLSAGIDLRSFSAWDLAGGSFDE